MRFKNRALLARLCDTALVHATYLWIRDTPGLKMPTNPREWARAMHEYKLVAELNN